ncbi:MAG: zinc ribbon domain-containing protein [Spirulinaceae cyanobacterium]
MPNCFQCHNLVDAEAVRCPHCGTTLKAFGHPGIPLYQATNEDYLCDTCLYHEDDSCTFPKRPYAKTCTLYCDRENPLGQNDAVVYQSPGGWMGLKAWCYRNRTLLILLIIVGISLWLALS